MKQSKSFPLSHLHTGKQTLFLPLFLTALLLFGCGKQEVPEDKTSTEYSSSESFSSEETFSSEEASLITFTDALDRTVTMEKPTRTAAAIGSFADIWCLAGGKDTLVAAASDSFSSFSLDLPDTVVNIGSAKDPSLELLLSAEPDFVLASVNTKANLEWLDTLEAAGIAVAYFDVECFDDYLHMLKICTDLTGETELYTRNGTQVQDEVEAALARQDDSHPTVLYVRASASGCSVKGSEGNVLGVMLKDMGCVNIADNNDSLLEELSMEAIMEQDPDYIFLLLQGTKTEELQAVVEESLLSDPAWESLRAVKENRVYYMEHTMYNLKPNSRWGEAYEKLADILYPDQTKQ